MKIIRPLAAIVATLAVLTAGGEAQSPGGASIPWHTRVEDGRRAALKADTPMLLEFWAGWCAPCKVMDAEVYSNARVAAAMTKVVPVRIDMDAQGVLAREYKVEGIPTLVFADSHGNELFRYTGVLDANQMVALLGELPGDVAAINRLSAAVAINKNDFTSLEALGRELQAASLFKASNQYYLRALRTPTASQSPDRRAAVLLEVAKNQLKLRAFREAARSFEQYLKDFSGSASEPVAMLGLGQAWLAQQKPREGRRILQDLITRHPASASASEAARLLAVSGGV